MMLEICAAAKPTSLFATAVLPIQIWLQRKSGTTPPACTLLKAISHNAARLERRMICRVPTSSASITMSLSLKVLNALGLKLTPKHFPVLSNSHLMHWELVKQGIGIGVMITQVGDAEPMVRRAMPWLKPFEFPIWLVADRKVKQPPSAPSIRLAGPGTIQHLNSRPRSAIGPGLRLSGAHPRARNLERGEDFHFSKTFIRRRVPCRRYGPELAFSANPAV